MAVGDSDNLDKICEQSEQEYEEVRQLKECFVVNNVSQTVSDDLSKILRARLLPKLPKSTKTLLKCDIDFHIKNGSL